MAPVRTPPEPAAGRRALVVGAAQGIGRAVAARLVADGHRVVATHHRTRPEPLAGVGYEACDIRVPAQVDELFAAADRAGDPFDVVVANAAVLRDRMVTRMSDDDFAAVVDVNLRGTFRVVRAAAERMAARRWGRIVLVSSVGGWVGAPGQANYAATKTGLLGLARAVAREVGPRSVTVNLVAPGIVDTELLGQVGGRVRERWLAMVPAGRMGTPAEVAATVAFLASDRAAFVTGAVVPVDGGLLVRGTT